MIPGINEILRSVYGAWRLAFFDRNGMNHFNLSIDGFWRSFFAMVLALPLLYVLPLVLTFSVALPDPSGVGEPQDFELSFSLIDGFLILLNWALFPVVMVYLSRALKLDNYYVPYVIARNWVILIQIAAYLAVGIVIKAFFPATVAIMAMSIVSIVLLVYEWFATKTALNTKGFIAIGILIADEVTKRLIGFLVISAFFT